MKRVLAWVLLLVMVLGMFAGCKPAEDTTPTTEPATTAPQSGIQGPGAQDAIDYLKSLYQDDGAETAVDFNRYGIIRVGGIEFTITWSTDVAEELVKVVTNEDGTVTIDINEQCEEATPYKLTATITDGNGNVATHTWNYTLPKAQDMVEIVKAAYALGKGESLPYQSRLIGKIISIDAIWTDEYQNITVTIVVEGAEDMPIKCYRMKATDNTLAVIKDLLVGNIITVIGTLKNYEGTIEFDAGCLLEKVEKGDAKEALTDPGEILKAAYALKKGESLPNPATLTGTVIAIDSPYDPQYGNISVVIEVEGYPQYPMLCYRLKGTGVDEIAIDDLITVSGIIKNYNGKIEYDAGCMMLERVSGGGVAQKPSSDAAKILADAAKLKPGESLPYRATLTGEIVSVDNAYSAQYANVTVTMKVNGMKIQCYRMVGDGIDQIRETDTITVSGVIKNYNGKLEFDTKCNLDSWTKGPRNVNYGPVKEDVAYRLYMDQKATGNTVYFTGEVSSNRLQTTTTGSKGADVFAERHSKGLRFYYLDGETKTYIEIEEFTNDEGKQRGGIRVTTEPTCYWVYNSDCGVYIVNLPTAGKYFLGTYGTYETISASWIGYIDGSYSGGSTQYVAKFIEASKVQDQEPGIGGTGVLVTNPQVGVAYKWGIEQKNKGVTLYFAGTMSGYYGATSENIDNGVNVVLEEANGGYYISFTAPNGAKKYINAVVSGTHKNFTIADSPVTVYKYDSQYNTFTMDVEGTKCYIGTYGDYNTFSISTFDKIGTSFPSHFYTVGEPGEEPEVTEPEVTEPATGAEMVTNIETGKAYKFGIEQKNKGVTLYFAGTMNGYYGATTENIEDGVDVVLEAANGGYYISFTAPDGAKKYINGVVSGTHKNFTIADSPATVYQYNAEYNTMTMEVGGAQCYIGTYGTYNTFSISTIDKIGTSFPSYFVAVGEGSEPEVTEPETTEPETTEPVAGGVEVGKVYKWAIDQENKGVTLYFAGTMNGYYGATTENIEDGVDVVLEAANGGYYISFTAPDGAKKYINGVVSGTHKNFTIADSPATVYQYNAEYNTMTMEVGGAQCYIGTYGTYNTFSISTIDKIGTSFPSYFVAVGEGSEPEVTEPETTEPETTEPVAGGVEVGKVYKWAIDQENKGVTLYFAGTMNGYYGATTENIEDGVDVVLEAANGGYYISFTAPDGAKKYINGVVSGTHKNFTIADSPATVYQYNAEYNTMTMEVGGAQCYIGTYGTYNTFSISTIDKIGTSFPSYFVAVGEGSEPEVTEPETTEPETTEPEATEPAGNGYNKITTAAQFTSGKYVMIVSTGYAPGVYDNTWLSAVQPVVSGNTVTDTKGAVWTLTVNGSSVTITDANGVVIKPKGGNNNGVAEGDYDWAWSFENGTFKFAGIGSDTVIMASNTSTTGQYPGNHRFRGYKTTTVSSQAANYPCNFTLYKLSETTGEEPEASEPQVTEPEVTEPVVTDPDVELFPLIFVDANNGVAMTALAENPQNPYGYLPKTNVAIEGGMLTGFVDANIFFFVPIEGTEEYAIGYMFDCYGRVLYMTGTHNSFNISDEIPAEGAEWKLTNNGDGTVYITNILKNKTVGFDSGYGTFGAYADAAKHTALLMIPVVDGEEPEATEPEATDAVVTEPSAGSSVTYTFSNYGPGEQYTDGETYELDAVTTMFMSGGHLNNQLRMYDDSKGDAQAIFTCTKAIQSLVINAGYRVADLEVYGSNDGENWVLIDTISHPTKDAYADYAVEMPAGTSYKYLKLDAVGAQVRIPYITFNFA